MTSKKAYGDYQTPFEFALKVCKFLKEEKNLKPVTIFEPTCGIGNFLKASLIFEAEQYFGVEINPEYCKICTENISNDKVKIVNKNFFECQIPKAENVLIIGNPPWINNSELSKLNSNNLPSKTNFKNLRGIDALTGASNFDICEYVIESLINFYRNTNAVIAMLCKISVAKNIFQEIVRVNVPFKNCEIFTFDAGKIFAISADACILYLELTDKNIFPATCKVYDFDAPHILKKVSGYRNGKFYNDISVETCNFDGNCFFEWRQGIKHDCAKIMELTFEDGFFKNGENKIVDVEDKFIFPLVKSSNIKTPIVKNFSKYVLVTQKFLGENTAHLKFTAPKLWNYLNQNADLLGNRKSKIYINAPQFAMFGIGEYSYKPYKVCIGGLNKTPNFSLIFSDDEKPVMLDDTCYFIGFENYDSAYTAMIYLNTDKVKTFLRSLISVESKRPFTKKILSRIDFSKICDEISNEELFLTENKLGLKNYLDENILDKFLNLFNSGEIRLFA